MRPSRTARPVLVAVFAVLTAASLFSAGCGGTTPFDVTITNVGSETTWLDAGDSTGVLIGFDQQNGAAWEPLFTSLAVLCTRQCGAPPGQLVCAESAAQLAVVHALLPGDSTSRSFDNEWWYRDEDQGCARRATPVGRMRARVWHGLVAIDANTGTALDEPSASGVQGQSGGASVEDPFAEEFEFDLEAGAELVFEIDEG